jgi:hypothetical protein
MVPTGSCQGRHWAARVLCVPHCLGRLMSVSIWQYGDFPGYMQHPIQGKHSLHFSYKEMKQNSTSFIQNPSFALLFMLSLLFLAPLKSRQIFFDAPHSFYVAISPCCSYTEGGMQEKSAFTARHFDDGVCLIREQVDGTRARDEKARSFY